MCVVCCVPLAAPQVCGDSDVYRLPQLSFCTSIEMSLKNMGTAAPLGHSWSYHCWWEGHGWHWCGGASPSVGLWLLHASRNLCPAASGLSSSAAELCG